MNQTKTLFKVIVKDLKYPDFKIFDTDVIRPLG